MQQTTKKQRLRLGCGLCLSLLGLIASGRAQEAGAQAGTKTDTKTDTKTEGAKTQAAPVTPPQTAPAALTPEQMSDLPLLLLVVQRPANTPARRDDINTSLSLMLRSSLRESRKFQVVLYSPEQPSIRRALLEHSIAASELVEPIPVTSLQKLAHLIGARYVLVVSSVLDKAGIKTGVRLQEDMGLDGSPESWITPHSEPVSVDAQFGKLRLKTDQMLALTVENIDSFLGIPSHLAANIHLNRTRTIGRPTDANGKEIAKNGRSDKTPQNNAPGGVAATDTAPALAQGDRDGGDGRIASGRGASDTTPGRSGLDAPPAKANVNGNGAGNSDADDSAGRSAAAEAKKTDAKAGAKKDINKDAKPPKVAKATAKKPPSKKPADAPVKPTRDAQVARNTDTPGDNLKDGSQDTSGRLAGGAVSTGQTQDRDKNGIDGETRSGRSNETKSSENRSSENRNGNAGRAAPRDARLPAVITSDGGAFLLAEPRIVPPVPPTDRVNHEQAADRYRRTGDLSNSIESLRQAINDNPADINLRKKLIIAYQDRQMLDQAVSETERAMQIAPGDADLSRLYANSLSAKGDTPGAIKLLRDIVSANPGNTANQVALGDALLSDSQFADALNAFEVASRNDPKSPLPHRRLARVLAARAGSDTAQYAACLSQIAQARGLTPAAETQTYQSDYFEIMLLLESRLRDMLDQTKEILAGSGRRPASELMRAANDLKERAGAAADFLDKLPPAAGQDILHAHYQQGAAQLVQTVGFLRKYLQTGDNQVSDSARGTHTDALTELSTAHARLMTARAALEKGKAAIGASTASN